MIIKLILQNRLIKTLDTGYIESNTGKSARQGNLLTPEGKISISIVP